MGKRQDITGRRFGRLTAVGPTSDRDAGSVVWHCKCDCGVHIDVGLRRLSSGNTTSCGCLCRDHAPRRDLTGLRFGRLTVVEAISQRAHRCLVWRCRCDCGTETMVVSGNLVNGNTTSCGCLQYHLNWNGVRFRSRWEAAVYFHYMFLGLDPRHEDTTITLTSVLTPTGSPSSYTPDIRIPVTGELIEVKGQWRDYGMAKYRAAISEGYNIRLMGESEIRVVCGVSRGQIHRSFSKSGIDGVYELMRRESETANGAISR